MAWGDIPGGTMCGNCAAHPATRNWYGDSSIMGVAHMSPQWWCLCCTLQAQITYCEERAATLPGLRAELERAACRYEP